MLWILKISGSALNFLQISSGLTRSEAKFFHWSFKCKLNLPFLKKGIIQFSFKFVKPRFTKAGKKLRRFKTAVNWVYSSKATFIFFGFFSSGFGISSTRTPSLNFAEIFSTFTSIGSVNALWNFPVNLSLL